MQGGKELPGPILTRLLFTCPGRGTAPKTITAWLTAPSPGLAHGRHHLCLTSEHSAGMAHFLLGSTL